MWNRLKREWFGGRATAFEPYALTSDQIEALCARLRAWAGEIDVGGR